MLFASCCKEQGKETRVGRYSDVSIPLYSPSAAAVTFHHASQCLLFRSWVLLREMGLDTCDVGDLPDSFSSSWLSRVGCSQDNLVDVF